MSLGGQSGWGGQNGWQFRRDAGGDCRYESVTAETRFQTLGLKNEVFSMLCFELYIQ